MGKFCLISTELWPFICVENWFPCSISVNFWPIVFILYICVDIKEEWIGIVDGYMSSN